MAEADSKSVSARPWVTLRRTVLLALAAWLLWQVLAVNMAEHRLVQALEGEREAIDRALWWRSEHPRALALKGRWLLRDGEPEAAEPWLKRAIRANPADARPLVDLARVRAQAGDLAIASDMLDTASQLMPANSGVQHLIGLYWLEHGELARAVGHIGTALKGDPALRELYFPLLMGVADVPELRSALEPFALEPPVWWRAFFAYTASNASSADTLGALVALRTLSPSEPLQAREHELYLQRLRRDGRVDEAFLHWVNGLQSEQLQELGYVFNGSFERPLLNAGFGWFSNVPRNTGFQIATGSTFGVLGQRALRLNFNGTRARFNHLYQYLFLGAGDYEVSGMVRLDGLLARRGLQWRVQCSAGGTELLGESELLQGTSDWRRFGFNISVPAGCNGQLLRLYSAGNREVDHELSGGIWFDDLRIQRHAASPSAEGESP